jgi:hypothetical protein
MAANTAGDVTNYFVVVAGKSQTAKGDFKAAEYSLARFRIGERTQGMLGTEWNPSLTRALRLSRVGKDALRCVPSFSSRGAGYRPWGVAPNAQGSPRRRSQALGEFGQVFLAARGVTKRRQASLAPNCTPPLGARAKFAGHARAGWHSVRDLTH